ncbi:MAG: hypothetical protein IT215_02515 [Chitinophagaceae bacterium]|nr:MAG: hypothetical protein UZ11_BCD004001977 [Bacteroidetes bacterium OLB11]MCC6447539.1 hypothetical protein [Chitinophagaceae bacterium]HMN32982.1 hypothetical protein [Chitinophagaceae bacterium]
MEEYVFYTLEGYTFSPTNKELENIQILGFEKGDTLKEAFENLIKNNNWIKSSGFNIDEIKNRRLFND